MKRALLVVAGLIVVAVLAFVGTVGSAFMGLIEAVPGEVAPGVELVRDGYVNLFIVEAGEGVVLIDCGNDPEGKAVLTALKARKLDASAVKAIFLTHGHRDHTSGCANFPQAALYAFEVERPLVEGRESGKGPLPRMMKADPSKGRALTNALTDGDPVTVGTVQVTPYPVPGHTAGSAVYFARSVLFMGDTATGQKDGKVRGAPWAFSDDVAQNNASLEALAKKLTAQGVRVDKLAFAHSGSLDGLAPLASFH
jgi:glyoxylase-like metal-dependent hydrolase (beta-lactamase superfamily II)